MPQARDIFSRAGPGGLPAGADCDWRGSKEDLGSQKEFMLLAPNLHQPAGKAGYGAGGVLQLLMPLTSGAALQTQLGARTLLGC